MIQKLCFLMGAALVAVCFSSSASAQESRTYTYDALGRLVGQVSDQGVNDGDARTYCYDDAGNRTRVISDESGALANCGSVSAPSLSVSDASASEGGSLSFTVTLSATQSAPVSVNYATAYGSADSADFAATSGVVTFEAGQASRSVSVSTIEDVDVEGSESFTLTLSSPSAGATVSRGSGTGLIYDDD